MAHIHPSIVWACVGIGLIIIEVFTTSFFLLFFGIAALVVAAIALTGFHNLPVELLAFAVLGLLGILAFRGRIKKSFTTNDRVLLDQNKVITLTEDLPVGTAGKTFYRGTSWMAVNNSPRDMKKGDSVVIEKIEGISLILNLQP